MKKDSLKKDRAVAIIGMGGLFPGAMDIKDYWRLLSRGEDAITEVPDTHWSAEDYYNEDTKAGDYTYCKRGGFLPAIPYDPTEFGIPPNILEATDTSQLLALVATRMALEDAGYGPGGKPWNRDRTGVVLGATGTQELVIPLASRLGFPLWKKALEDAGVPEDQAGDVVARLSDAYVQWQENSFPGLLGNVIAGRIANRFDLGGTNCVVDAACASSLSAINLAALELLSGKCDMMITGGVDTLNDIFMHMCFAKTSVLSFTGDAKPFSKDADGTVLGEGLGIVILKRLSDAEADGDKIYAVIRGVGTSSDGKSAGIYAPVAEGQLKALKQAYEEADVPPDTVELIEAHGTGTRVGDAVEFEALATFFRDAGAEPGNRCAIGSVKSMIGHTKAAAGAASLIKASLALHHKAILPTIKVDEPDPKLKIDETPFYISTTLRPWFSDARHPRRAGVSSFGFGGSNFHMVLEEYVPEKRDVAWDGTVEIAAFSGSTKSDVNEQLKKFADDVSSHKGKPGGVFRAVREEAAKTREKFSHKALHRLLLVIRRDDDIAAIFKDAVDALNGSGNPAGKAVFYDVSEDSHGKTAFLFPGQGSQYPYMGRDLVVTFPEAHHTFEIANIQFSRLASRPGTRLTDFVFPAGYTKKDRKAAEELLRSTDIAQPAIGALSLGMARILERFNIGADMMCGHSFGELSALRGAGWMDDETFLALASARGKYMAAAGKEKGAMMAVKAKLADIEKFLLENDLDLVLANRNSYEQGVLSGREDEIDRALELCKQNKLRATKLTVSAAFHTGLVQDAAKPFKDYLRKKNITTGKIKVFSNVTAEAYPDDPAGVKKILGSQILNPVNFVEEIENMYADGARVYVEVGPKSVLTGLVKSILKGRDFHAIAMDGSAGRSSGIADLAAVLCFLASRGYPVDFAGWETRPVAEPRKQKMSIPICGANYRKEKPARPKRRIAAKPQPAADGPDTNPAKPSATSVSSMRSQAPVSGVRPDSSMVKDALAMVSESLKSMQALQQQTADAHRKFLETQTEAGRALAAVLEKTRNISETILGKAEPGAARIPQTVSPEPVAPPPVSEPSAGDVGKETKPEAIKTAPPAGVKPGASGVSQEQIESAMLDIVSRVTGYPVDMLGLEMDIENDLGIDSIKRVEILSVFEEEHPDIPSAAPEDLAEMRTLKEICDHLVSLSGAVAPAAAAPAGVKPGASGVSQEQIESAMLDIVSRVTGYPVDMLGLEMDIENDLGIDSIKRVEILSVFEEEHPDIPSAAPEDLAEMRTLKEICDHLVSLSGAVAPAAAAPAGVKPGASGVSQEQIESAMLDIVSRVTGYPVDMLGLEMDIENDLGIDSIKRVEILSVFEEEHPDIPSAAPEDLAEMRTLKEICDHLVSLSGAGLSCADSTAKTGKTPQPEGEDTDVSRRVIRIDSSPVAIGKPLELDKDRTVFLYASDTRWGEDIASALGDLGIKTAIIKDPSSDVDFSTATGLVLLGSFARHDNVLWHVEDETIIKQVFSLVQRAAPFLKQAARQGRDAVFAAVTSLDGEMGFGKSKGFSPIQGALAGLAKTAAIEWEGVKCRHIDVDPSWIGSPDCSSAVAREILNSDGPLETGLCDGARKTLCLVEEKCPDGELLLGPGDVVMVSGGARGVTARCMIALAEKTRPVLVILGRSPLPSKEPDWLSGVTGDSEIKKRIIANEFAEKSATPAEVDRHFKRYMANREVEENLARLKELCTDVVYHSVDVRDAKAVAGICESVKKTFGPVRCLVHGAGVLEDKLIEEKTPEQFERVFDTKVAGARALLSALDMDELRYLVFFSSVSARMGNKGQVDYAMANEVLNKTAQQLAMQYGSCRVISFNWGPWDGGMVTPALKREFKKNNVPLIPLGAGSRRMVAEMAGTSEDVEVVIGAGFHDTEADAVTLSGSTVAGQSDVSPPKASLKKKDALFPAFTLKLDIDSCPILSHHILNGKPVVPFALALEWLGNGALHANPGLLLTGFEDMRVLSGIRLDNDSKGLKVMVGKPVRKDSAFEIDVQLHDSDPENRRVYYAAKAVLSSGYDSPPVFSAPPALFEKNYKKGVDELYGPVLFHGTALHGIKDVASCSKEGIKVFASGAPSPRNWIKQPVRNTWLADPLVIDCAFQAAIVWCHENAGMVSLPVGFRSFRQYRPSFQKEGTVIVLEIKEQSGRKIKGDVTFLDSNNEKEVVARMLGYEAIMDKSLEAAFKS